MITVEKVELDLRKLEKFAAMNDYSVGQAIAATAFQVTGLAQSKAPVKTGFLKNQLGPERIDELEWRVADHTDYGIFQELGTYKMAAHPFLVPALRKAIQQLYDAVAKEYAKLLR